MSNSFSNSTAARDVAFHVHSQTNPRMFEEHGPQIVTKGKGARIYDAAGKEYIDAMAGLWCASLGFSNDRLALLWQIKCLLSYLINADRLRRVPSDGRGGCYADGVAKAVR